MEWAEAAGVGELGLLPDEFWSLSTHEFNLKWDAFSRQEDRARALVFELAAMVGQYDEKARTKLFRSVNALRRYPIKRWLSPDLPR